MGQGRAGGSALIKAMNTKKYDIIIVGAGPAGAAAAYYLAKQGLQVVLIDKATFPREKTCGDGLTPRAIKVLAEMGLLPDLLNEGHKMDEATVFAPNGTPVTTQMPVVEAHLPIMLAIPRIKLDNFIVKTAVSASADLLEAVTIQDVESHDTGVTVVGRRHGIAAPSGAYPERPGGGRHRRGDPAAVP